MPRRRDMTLPTPAQLSHRLSTTPLQNTTTRPPLERMKTIILNHAVRVNWSPVKKSLVGTKDLENTPRPFKVECRHKIFFLL